VCLFTFPDPKFYNSHVSKSNIRDIAPLHRGRLVLQWHITDRCNLCCAHCYQEDHPARELPFQDLLKILEQFKELIDQLGDGEVPPVRGHINVSGGEPFVRKDFLDLLETFAANRDWLSFGILTNGTFIDETMAQRLRQLKPAFVQVSIEGTRVTNDNIRGRGALERTVSALKHLVREHIPSVISFTAHRGNFREFTEVALLGSELGVKRVWADRLIPLGSGESLKEQMLSPDETREFFNIMYRAHNEAMRKFSRTEISMHRALQFLVGGGHPYHCGAGETLITVLPNGDLYPCRRMPIRVGNLMETPLTELYFTCDLFCSLRNPNNISDECRDCIFSSKCRGGLKCLSYAVTGDPFKADPGCWRSRAQKKIAACEVPLQS
jgi:radical SAM protein with 4Fe4S-binding SPASM domain